MYREISYFNKSYQARTNIVKYNKVDLVTDSHRILATWRNHFSQLLNVLGVNDIRQIEVHAEEPLVSKPTAFEDEMAIEKLKRQKSQGTDQIPAELIRVEIEQFALRSMNLLILFGIRRNCLWSGRSRSLYLSIRRVIKQIVVIIEAYHFCQLRAKFYPASCCQG